jgi:hypothetical protein
MIRSEEKPWIVVITGVVTRSLYVSGKKSNPLGVNDVELAGALEYRGDVQALCDLGVDRRILRPATRHRCVQAGRGDRVCSGEEGDMMAGCHKTLGEKRRELLPRPVVPRRCPPRDRREHSNSDRTLSLASNGNLIRLPCGAEQLLERTLHAVGVVTRVW